MKIKFLFSILFLVFITNFSYSKGILRGSVIDGKTGETIPFANIYIEELQTGTTTDLDGKYSLELPDGKYSLSFSYIGYATYKVENIELLSGNVDVLDVKMKEEGTLLNEVVIQARQVQNTEAAIATIKRKSTKLLDGVSSQTFSRVGDSDAAEAIKRVSGVSTEEGKFVFVRGLGDRYTKTMLNSMVIPGLDPDRNTIQMDIFPTNLIDQIIVFKSFSPELPGDFTGGIVNIVTKDFPEDRTTNISASVGYNANMNFKNNFLSYKGGKTDRLGFDDGTRALPFSKSQYIPDVSTNDVQLFDLANSFSKEMASKKITSDLNHSFSLSHGNQLNFKNNSIGYITAVNYKNSYSHYDDALFENYIIDPNLNTMRLEDKKTGAVSTNDILLSALVSGSFKTKSHKISSSYLLIQNSEDKVANLTLTDFDDNPSTIIRDVLNYSQRTIHYLKFNGKHSFLNNKLVTNWDFSPTWVEVDEPDIRTTAFQLTNEGEFLIRPSIGADISRTFRNLKEKSLNGKIDFNYKFKQWNGLESKVSLGSNVLIKERDFGIYNYVFRVKSQNSLNLEGNPDNIFAEENLWQPNSDQGVYLKGNFEPANTFNAKQYIISGYLMCELPFSEKLKAIIGVRIEKVDNYYTGSNNLGTLILNNEKVLDEIDFLPSSNFIYYINNKMNLRLSYNKTLARPSFKEKSIAQIQDKISGRTFIGNLDLEETKIDNVDLRLEKFFTRAQMLSFSVFYKNLLNPIELESYNELSPDNYTPRNQDKAQVYGIEFEGRNNMGFISEAFDNLSLSVNASYIYSETKRESTLNIYNSDTRQMVGQAPYIVNTSLGYTNSDHGYDLNISYNLQGEKLSIVGIGLNPDIYESPFHSLDAKASVKLGRKKGWKLSINAGNILASEKKFVYDGGVKNDGEYIWSLFKPGRSYSLGLSYDFIK